MDLGALTGNLIALKETVNSIVINEDKNVGDFGEMGELGALG